MVEHSIREYCERAKSRFEQCTVCDQTRQFLADHIQRVIYLRSKVTLFGSVPIKRGTFQAAVAVPFRIESELDRKAIRAKPRKVLPDDGRWKRLNEAAADAAPFLAQSQPPWRLESSNPRPPSMPRLCGRHVGFRG